MHRMRSHLTYSNLMATVAVFLVLGSGAYAAFHLPKNSVRSKNIVNGQVKSKDLAPAKFKDAGLGVFPGTCGGLNEWLNLSNNSTRVSYARDGLGFVHLRGVATRCGSASSTVFKLPAGFRPSRTESALAVGQVGPTVIAINNTGEVESGSDIVSLGGVTFRCGPSGKKGCP
jgi:hypothetical protein